MLASSRTPVRVSARTSGKPRKGIAGKICALGEPTIVPPRIVLSNSVPRKSGSMTKSPTPAPSSAAPSSIGLAKLKVNSAAWLRPPPPLLMMHAKRNCQ